MKTNILKHLNPEQTKAVKSTQGPNLILAGAGSGKTRVLTYKVAYLIMNKKIHPENILMVTFTNKAAGEMKERITNLIKNKSLLPLTCTFHSFCAKVLRRDGKNIGIPPSFIIYDDSDSKLAIKDAMKKLEIDPKKIKPSAAASNISQAKNELIDPPSYTKIARGYFQEEVAKIYPQYQKILAKNHALDFEDLIFFAVKLLSEDKQTKKKYQNLFKYILVDEYQDTNHAQYVLTKILSGKWGNLTVVGDASQSIYAWRGADFRNINFFQRDYRKVKVFNLEQNYRSTQTILNAAYTIISKNKTHPILKLWTGNGMGRQINIYQARSEKDEAKYVIDNLIFKTLNETAVLYRTNAQSRILEEAFLRAGIPYILIGGVRFYERKEIKDIICMLRLIINPSESVSLTRVEKVGKTRLKKLLESVKNKRKIFQDQTTLDHLDRVLSVTGYLDKFNPKIEEDYARLENIKELKSVATEFPVLFEFLENVSLVEREYLPQHLSDYGKTAVTMMTMHAAKGLEFQKVFMVGMEEGLFPHSMSMLDPYELEEERRLCYVGFTRAKEDLHLTFAKNRLYFGQRSSNMVSRFVAELPSHLVNIENGNYFDF